MEVWKMGNRTRQELRRWAENISEPRYGRVTQKIVKDIILDRANSEELEQGFTRSDMRIIWQYVNEFNQ